MAVDADPEDDLPLDPPEQETDQEEEQETETEEQEEEDEPLAAQSEGDQQSGEQRPPSRRDQRIETLTTSIKEERQRRAELERRLDGLLAGQPRQPAGESPEQRAQRLALLTPEERITETLRESEQRHAGELRNLQFSIADGNDRAAFEAKATVDPLFAKWKPRVEAELTTLRHNGQNVDREKLMFYLIGKNAVEGRSKTVGQQRQQARARVNAQRTKPSNSGSDTAANRNRNSSLERRLENQLI
jgi:hypothetical protein